MDPDTPVSDDPLRAGELPKGFGPYNPSNSDDTYRGMLRAKDGLILSRNTMSVRVGAVAGIERVRESILASGIGTDVPKYPSIFLGSFSGTLRALTTAYAALVNDGVAPAPHLLERVEDPQGRVLYRYKGSVQRILPSGVARTTAGILREAMTQGTGQVAAAFGYRGEDAGGKPARPTTIKMRGSSVSTGRQPAGCGSDSTDRSGLSTAAMARHWPCPFGSKS